MFRTISSRNAEIYSVVVSCHPLSSLGQHSGEERPELGTRVEEHELPRPQPAAAGTGRWLVSVRGFRT